MTPVSPSDQYTDLPADITLTTVDWYVYTCNETKSSCLYEYIKQVTHMNTCIYTLKPFKYWRIVRIISQNTIYEFYDI